MSLIRQESYFSSANELIIVARKRSAVSARIGLV